jgi:hypothetical protein
MKKTAFATFLVLVLGIGAVTAQNNIGSYDYKTSLGVKFYPGAVTIKHFIKPNLALEGVGYFWERGARATGLLEFHFDIPNAPGLKWYVGPGAHLGFYNNKYYGGGTVVGIDGVVGLDYKFREVPINLSLDWQPSIEFGDYAGFTGNWAGFAVRYVF